MLSILLFWVPSYRSFSRLLSPYLVVQSRRPVLNRQSKGEKTMRKRISIGMLFVLLAVFCVPISPITYAQKKPPCKPNLAACPDEGCGARFDPNLNRRKNIRTDNQTATVRSLTFIKKLDDPENFSQGDTREELTALGEGQ